MPLPKSIWMLACLVTIGSPSYSRHNSLEIAVLPLNGIPTKMYLCFLLMIIGFVHELI